MVIKALITNVTTDAELTALTGMVANAFAWHEGNQCVYCYEPNFATGDVSSVDGGFWVKDEIEALDLNEYKLLRYQEIDTRSAELISLGYSYQGVVFSLSQNAQINILGMDEVRDELTYPVNYNNIDDTVVYSIVDAADVHNMYLTALGTKKAHLDSGTALKNQVRDAVDEAAVQAIIDNR